jgi:hypothetical protein
MNHPRLFDYLSKLTTTVCYVAPAIMAIADVSTVTLNHNFSPLKQTISGFATGSYGWLEKLGMIMVALSFLFIAINLLMVKNQKELRLLRSVGGMLVIVAIGFLIISIFNTNVIGTINSFDSFVHKVSVGAASVVFYVSCLILTRFMINKAGLRYVGLYGALTFLVGFIVFLLLSFGHQPNEYIGLLERMIAGFNLGWIVLVGPQAVKLARSLQ